MLRFSTAGESHGESLIATVSGMPAGVPIDNARVNRELWRRQQGYGRGGRMRIEQDTAHFLSGVRHGKTIGSPIAIEIENKDWKNWTEVLPVEAGDPAKHKAVASPRPGHADLAGALKYDFPDARYVLERASARESTARVAAGAVAKALLLELGIDIASHVIRVGRAEMERDASWNEITALRDKDEVLLGCVDEEAEARMKAEVDLALRTGDSIGGVFEVVIHGAPAGIGTYANWDERLDGILAQAVVSLQAVKAAEIGRGVTAAESLGSEVHDAIGYAETRENGAHTRQQLANLEWFHQIVVRAEIEPVDPVIDAVARGHDDHGEPPAQRAQAPKHLTAVRLRQPEIEQGQLVKLVLRRVDGGLAVGDPVDGIGRVLESLLHGRADHPVVLDQQNSHRLFLFRGAGVSPA